jgi:hypothetical protein
MGAVNFTPLPLQPRRKGPWYQLDRRLPGTLKLVCTLWSKEKTLAPVRNQTLGSRVICGSGHNLIIKLEFVSIVSGE